MMTHCVWLLSIMILLSGVMGCTAVSSPTPTPTTTSAPPTERPLPTPSATATPLLERTAVPTLTASPTPPTHTPTPTVTPFVLETATAIPEIVWSTSAKVLSRISTNSLVWSPVSNGFVFDTCPDDRFPPTPHYVFVATAPNFVPIDVSSPEVTCRRGSSFIWRPDGQQIVFTGLPAPEDDLIESELWIMDRNGQNLQSLGRRGSFLDSFGWMDNDTFVYRDHWGGSSKLVHILEISTNVELANAYIHAAEINAITPDLIITDNGMQTEGPYSAAVIANQIFNPDDVLRSHIKNLSSNDHAPYLFNSRVVDTVLSRNQVLVRTWDASEYLTDTLHTPVDLQLWDPQTDELTMLIPGSYTGRITPDGQYLAALIPESEFPQLQLSNQFTGQVIFMRPAYDGKLSFSPNGRYFTFFTPETDLAIYDLETGEMLPSLTAVPALPIWSPDSTRFVYTDPTLGLSIYDTRNNTTFPLAESGGERLSNPQWSFDGAYLSVVTKIGEVGEWEWQTAVLTLP